MPRLIVIVLLMLPLSLNARSISMILEKTPIEELLADFEGKSVELTEASKLNSQELNLAVADDLASTQFVKINSEQGALIHHGDFSAISTVVGIPTYEKVTVNSFLVKPKKGKKYIFYPSIKALGQNGEILDIPKLVGEETRKRLVSRTFLLPEGTRFLVVYADPDNVSEDFMKQMKAKDKSDLLAGMGAALGGALGATLVGMLSGSGAKIFSPVGYVEIVGS